MPEPEWLTEEELTTWRPLMVMIHRLDAQLDRQLQRDAQMTHASYRILAILSTLEQYTPSMSELARQLDWSQSRLSHAMASLEKSGWARRTPSATDKRSNLAQITDEGRRKLDEAARGHAAEARHLVLEALTAEQRRCLAQISEVIIARAESPRQ
jgi:DNA-binding MarR family transcriptional regulator